MDPTTVAALTASPRYQDRRTSDQRFCAIARYFDEAGLSDSACQRLACQELDPREETHDLAPFDNYFQSLRKDGIPNGPIAPFVASWLAEDTKDTASRFQDVRHLLRDIKDCEYALAAVSLVRPEPGSYYESKEDKEDRAECVTKVGEVQAIATRLQNQFQDLTTTSPFVEVYGKDQACHTTPVVFIIPELVEHVLRFVDNEDVLRLQAVSRTFNKIIEGSGTLQRRLGLQPDSNGRHTLPLDIPDGLSHCRGLPGFGCYSRAADGSLSYALEHNLHALSQLCSRPQPPAELADFAVHSWLEVIDGKLPTIGSRYQAMLLCQPPITKMTMRLSYVYDSSRRGHKEAELELYRRDEDGTVLRRARPGTESIAPSVVAEGPGLTLGQLWDAAENLLCDQGRLRQEEYEQRGLRIAASKWPFAKKMVVNFEGTLRLRYDDPAIAPGWHPWWFEPIPSWRTVSSFERKQMEDYSKRSNVFRRVMRTANMRDRKNPTAEELQVAWFALREIVMSMEECELRDAETVSEEQLTSETEST
ncbi:hypothetical protein LTR56_003318 [Elasticomyces elasticus]|nr:hypothetical protein LTR56_003318 [Elasticomyces elasticus]KAK5766001.1 hypothetical protein LTS12_003747 [Elasticomyces elasticus]